MASHSEVADLLTDLDDPNGLVALRAGIEINRRTLPAIRLGGDLSEVKLQARLARRCAVELRRGPDSRAAVRDVIRHHYDPSWFALEVLHESYRLASDGPDDLVLALADLRRLLKD